MENDPGGIYPLHLIQCYSEIYGNDIDETAS